MPDWHWWASGIQTGSAHYKISENNNVIILIFAQCILFILSPTYVSNKTVDSHKVEFYFD